MLIKNFLLIYSLQILLTINNIYKTCKKKSIYFFHHLFDVFLFWSFLFITTRHEHIAHFLILIGVVIHWLSYKNKCIITVLMNRECGYPEDLWLDSIKNMLHLRNISENFHFIWMFILATHDIVNIIY